MALTDQDCFELFEIEPIGPIQQLKYLQEVDFVLAVGQVPIEFLRSFATDTAFEWWSDIFPGDYRLFDAVVMPDSYPHVFDVLSMIMKKSYLWPYKHRKHSFQFRIFLNVGKIMGTNRV